jgi:hypothetical protein
MPDYNFSKSDNGVAETIVFMNNTQKDWRVNICDLRLPLHPFLVLLISVKPSILKGK